MLIFFIWFSTSAVRLGFFPVVPPISLQDFSSHAWYADLVGWNLLVDTAKCESLCVLCDYWRQRTRKVFTRSAHWSSITAVQIIRDALKATWSKAASSHYCCLEGTRDIGLVLVDVKRGVCLCVKIDLRFGGVGWGRGGGVEGNITALYCYVGRQVYPHSLLCISAQAAVPDTTTIMFVCPALRQAG